MGSSGTTYKRQKLQQNPRILGSYLKFKGQNLGYLSPIFLETTFGDRMQISEANFGVKLPDPPDMKVSPWVTANDANLLGLLENTFRPSNTDTDGTI